MNRNFIPVSLSVAKKAAPHFPAIPVLREEARECILMDWPALRSPHPEELMSLYLQSGTGHREKPAYAFPRICGRGVPGADVYDGEAGRFVRRKLHFCKIR